MNAKRILLTATAICLAACSHKDNPAESKVPVTFTYSTGTVTEAKAAQNLNEGRFASGQRVMVRISETGSGSWTDFPFTIGADGSMTAPDPAPYYPDGNVTIDIAAFYPATAGPSFSVATDQTADADFMASQLMFASVAKQARQNESVELVFTQKMAKICVNVIAGTGVSGITGVSILNVKPTVSFNPATGEVGEAGGTPASIAVSNNGAAIIPAQILNGELLAIDTEQGTATYTVENKAFEAGHLYTLNISVNLQAVGAATAITGWTSTGSVTVSPKVEVTNAPDGVEAVDLGLPSGLKWANMNIGATTPTQFGYCFAWGETSTDRQQFNWATYSWAHASQFALDRYCPREQQDSYWFDKSGKTVAADGKTTLEPGDDAAHALWGGDWRMPTEEEWEELLTHCDWVWQKNFNRTGGVGEYVKGSNGNFIFIPRAGAMQLSGRVEWEGHYWSSSLSPERPDEAMSLFFKYTSFALDPNVRKMEAAPRPCGYYVRAVKP